MTRIRSLLLLVLCAPIPAQEGFDPRDRPRYRLPLSADTTRNAIAGPFEPPGLPFPDRPDWRLWWSFHWEELLEIPPFAGRELTRKDKTEHLLPGLIAGTRDGDPAVHACAVIALGKSGFEEGLPALLTALKDNNLRVRNAAALGLGLLGGKGAEAPLLALFRAEDTRAWTQVWTAVALGYLGTPAARKELLDRIAALATSSSSADVTEVLVACGMGLSVSRSADGIAELLANPKVERNLTPPLRAVLIEALGRTRGRAAVAMVEKELGSPEAVVRASAAAALGTLATVEDSACVSALERAATRDAHGAVRAQAAIALGRLGGAGPIKILTELSTTEAGDKELRPFFQIARALARDAEVRPLLVKQLAAGDVQDRSAAAIALGILGDAAVGRELVHALEQEKNHVAFADLAIACGMLRVQEARRVLELALAREDEAEQRTAAAVALFMLGAEDVPARLAKLLASVTSARRQAPLLFAAMLGRDPRLIDEIVRLARRDSVQDTIRALAWSALGHIADPRPRPALGALASGHSWLVSFPHVDELLTIY